MNVCMCSVCGKVIDTQWNELKHLISLSIAMRLFDQEPIKKTTKSQLANKPISEMDTLPISGPNRTKLDAIKSHILLTSEAKRPTQPNRVNN